MATSQQNAQAIWERQLVEHLGENPTMLEDLTLWIRQHGAIGIEEFVRRTVERHLKLAEAKGKTPGQFRTALKRALATNALPVHLSGKRDQVADSRAAMAKYREPGPHPDTCTCGGRGWISDRAGRVPKGARVLTNSPSGGTTYYCPHGPIEEVT